MELDLVKGLEEINTKSDRQIDLESALSWANKSAAAYSKVVEVTDIGNKVAYLIQAEDFRREMVEHAAMADDEGAVLKEFRDLIDSHREAAIGSFLNSIPLPPNPNEQA